MFLSTAKKAGRIEGAFIRGKFDVTDLVKPGKNAVAVLIIKNDNIGVVKEATATYHDKTGIFWGLTILPIMHPSAGTGSRPSGKEYRYLNDVFLTVTALLRLRIRLLSRTFPCLIPVLQISTLK